MSAPADSRGPRVPSIATQGKITVSASEVLVITGLAVVLIHVLITGGKSSTDRSIRVEEEPDGRRIITSEEHVRYGIADGLIRFLTNFGVTDS